MYILLILFTIVAMVVGISYICYVLAFRSTRKKEVEEFPIPQGKIYEEMREDFIRWLKEVRSLPCRKVSIISHDGLKLTGKYYEYSPDAPIEILFHGWRGTAESDLSGGVLRCRRLGHSALIVDHRGCGESDGHVITFGAREKHDLVLWVDFVLKEINPEARIILTGISMGAATVCLASDKLLPENVVGILADCGYTSAEKIIYKVISDMHLPPKLLMPAVKLASRMFAHFDLREADVTKALENSRVPVIFFHGTGDDFVPCEMSEINFNACVSRKALVTIDKAGHGLCYPVDPEKYLDALEKFFNF